MSLVGAAALLILISVISHYWWTGGEGSRGSAGISPLSMQACRRDRCQAVDLSSVPGIYSHAPAWVIFGAFTFYFGLASVGPYGFAIYRAATRNPGRGGKSAGVSAISTGAIAAVAGTLFLLTAPSELSKGMSMSAGYFLLLAGAGCAIGGGVMLRQWEQEALAMGGGAPMGAPMGAPAGMPMAPGAPAPAAAGPNCPLCGTQARWVPEYSRWWCERDKQYL